MKHGSFDVPPCGEFVETRPNVEEHRTSTRRLVNCPARVKALDPLTSTRPPSMAQVVEFSEQGLKLRMQRSMITGTLVQLHVERSFSLWKVRYCQPDGDQYHVGLEMAKIVNPLLEQLIPKE